MRRRQILREFEDWPLTVSETPVSPTFTRSVGTATGTFTANWLDAKPESPYGVGSAEINMVLDGEPVEFTKVGIYGRRDKGKKGEDPTRTIVFVGKRKSNRMRITMRMSMSETRYLSANPELPIIMQGNLEEGGFGLFGLLSTNGVRLVGGHLTIDEAAQESDDQVTGSITLHVVRFVEGKPKSSQPAKEDVEP